MNLTPEERAVGQSNFLSALEVSRRDFLKGAAAATLGGSVGLGAVYFGYEPIENPVRVGFIGTGDEGGVLIGAINPDYIQVKAIADIRPSNVHRAFHGDWSSPSANAARKGLMSVYGYESEDEARRNIKVYGEDYRELLKDPDIEGVIIAVPLHLHAQVAADAMMAGKHVLTEKLMAHNVAQCKAMSRISQEQDLLLATGHQRHYSVLYDNAVNLIQWGLLGQIHHIRAQWHRGNLPGRDSWALPLPGGEDIPGASGRYDPIKSKLDSLARAVKTERDPVRASLYKKQLAQWEAWNADQEINPEDYGYESMTLSDGRVRSAMEELCRWRLWERTGGGLMAELGSHQLDAATIFISALRNDGKKARPLSVHAVGGRHIFPYDRDADDHVYCMFEFPGPAYEFPESDAKAAERAEKHVGYYDPVNRYPNPEEGIPSYEKDPNKKIVVTYSSINGNGFGGYGEVVLGSKGTLVLEREKEVMLYKDSATSTNVKVAKGDGGPTLDTTDSGASAPTAELAGNVGPVSRGYQEEMEHWAWCIRNRAPENKPKCHPEVALGDAIIALTAKLAIANSNQGKSGYIDFQKDWFDINHDATPDGSVVEEEMKKLTRNA